MKNTKTQLPEPSMNLLLIGIYCFAFIGIVLLLYAALPLVGDVLHELRQGAAARMTIN